MWNLISTVNKKYFYVDAASCLDNADLFEQYALATWLTLSRRCVVK